MGSETGTIYTLAKKTQFFTYKDFENFYFSASKEMYSNIAHGRGSNIRFITRLRTVI